MRSTRRQLANSGVAPGRRSVRLRLAGSSRRHLCLRVGRSFDKRQIGRVNRAAVVLVIEPDEHSAGVYRGDDAVPVASLRRPVDDAASEVGLLGSNHVNVPFAGVGIVIETQPERDTSGAKLELTTL